MHLKAAAIRMLLGWAALLAGRGASAADYYINSAAGNDSNPGTSAGAPWSTFTPVSNLVFLPGDTINLATGSRWNQALDLYGSGTAAAPIIVRPYGANSSGNQSSGAMAVIARNNQVGDHCIYIHNPNYIQIVGLELAAADTALFVVADQDVVGNYGFLVYRCYFLNCAASDSVQNPSCGIYIRAPSTLSSPTSYLAGIQISGNLFDHCSAAWWINADNDGYASVFQMNIQNNWVENQLAQSYATRSSGTLLQDNWFENCATVALPTGGDTVVTTGLTQDMAFVNNVFLGVPDVGAHDQTAVDEEIATTNQAYFGNVFYNTAGAGVEVVDIHGTGYGSTGSFFDGNLFYQNGWSATGVPDAVGSYETSGDTLTGMLNNNLYYEPDSGFLFIQGLAHWTQSNNLSVDNPAGVYNAALGFTGTQGANHWTYEQWSPGAGWSNLSGGAQGNDSTYAWDNPQYGDALNGWITNLDLGPSVDNEAWIARVWTAPSAGKISIRGFVQSALFPGQGPSTGAAVQISAWPLDSGAGTYLWGGVSGQSIAASGYSTDLDGIAVTAGERIAFAVNNGGAGDNVNAAVSWNPTVYFTSNAAPVVTVGPAVSLPVTNGSTEVQFTAFSPGASFQWALNGVNIPGATESTLTVAGTAADEGAYSVTATNLAGASTAAAGTLTVTTNAWLGNLSARAYAEPASNQLIAGFVTTGPSNKILLIRGIGPSLAGFGVNDFLADPALTVATSSAALDSTTAWSTALVPLFHQLGAFDLVPGSADTALVETLSPGAYSAAVVSRTNQSGVALAEVYDADGGAPANRLINLSARAYVGTGAGVLIGGFVIDGTTPLTVVIRGDGPALTAFGIAGALPTPTLTVSDSMGTIASNTGWGNPSTLGNAADGSIVVQPLSKEVATKVQAFPLAPGSLDSAMVVTLPPGAYTAAVSGGRGAAGVALIEVYELR